MSTVTNIILTCLNEKDSFLIRKLVLRKENYPIQFSCNDFPENYGGDRFLEMFVHVAAFNHINIKDVCSILKIQPFISINQVQLFVCEQHDTKFREIDWREYENPT